MLTGNELFNAFINNKWIYYVNGNSLRSVRISSLKNSELSEVNTMCGKTAETKNLYESIEEAVREFVGYDIASPMITQMVKDKHIEIFPDRNAIDLDVQTMLEDVFETDAVRETMGALYRFTTGGSTTGLSVNDLIDGIKSKIVKLRQANKDR